MSVKHTVTENGSILCRDHGWLELGCSGLCLEWHTSWMATCTVYAVYYLHSHFM